ncbi:AraC family transcriptional regulator [Actinophytocola sp.]|uniref:AraC family transcriptional regulator n=1 Tax=Actinophytocola sp. TaxID=1872138 RepID=UPI002D425555|nr:AraC family transcriptional regulator [Actinophytocola sp.]HYQ69848.1 AraC family transcriptional regulator [Actinophytocola sp.]
MFADVDVVSDVISAMRLGKPHSTRTERRAPWAVRHEPFAGAGFHLVLEGTCWLTTPDGTRIELRAGDVAFLPHGGAHALAGDPTAPTEVPPVPLTAPSDDPDNDTGPRTVMLCGAYLMDRSWPHPLLRELPDLVHLPGGLGRHQSLRGAVELLATELAWPRLGRDAVVPALLDALLLYMIRAWLEDQPEGSGWTTAVRDPAVRTALLGIHSTPGRQWTVASLGELAGLSRAAFARRFTSLVGQPPLGYLTWWRMILAARLLRASDAPLRSVAAQVGYTSEFAFGAAFKRQHGLTPGAYRRKGTT